MSSIKSISTLLALLLSVQSALCQSSSQAASHPQSGQPQPHATVGEGSSNAAGKSQESSPVYMPYAYRSSLPGSGGTTNNVPSYPTYPSSSSYNNRDSSSYSGTSRDVSGGGGGDPLFGVSSNAEFQLSAYFGQIFWGIVAVTLTLIVSIWIIRFFAGTDVVGSLVDRIRDSSAATGKSLDLDGVTNMVYEAFETYGKFAAKEARHAAEISATANKGHR